MYPRFKRTKIIIWLNLPLWQCVKNYICRSLGPPHPHNEGFSLKHLVRMILLNRTIRKRHLNRITEFPKVSVIRINSAKQRSIFYKTYINKKAQ